MMPFRLCVDFRRSCFYIKANEMSVLIFTSNANQTSSPSSLVILLKRPEVMNITFRLLTDNIHGPRPWKVEGCWQPFNAVLVFMIDDRHPCECPAADWPLTALSCLITRFPVQFLARSPYRLAEMRYNFMRLRSSFYSLIGDFGRLSFIYSGSLSDGCFMITTQLVLVVSWILQNLLYPRS